MTYGVELYMHTALNTQPNLAWEILDGKTEHIDILLMSN